MDYKRFVLDLKNKGFVIGDEIVGFRINPYFELPRSLGFEDVAIFQEENSCASRLDVDITSEVFRGVYLKVPLLAANMMAVTNADFCNHLYSLGALGVLHRGWKHEADYLAETKKISDKCSLVAASIGAGPGQVELATRLINSGANVIFIDIAQGYSTYVIETGRKIKKQHPNVKVVVGNTINPEMLYKVADFADAVKVGIAGGSVCETKNTAGCTAGLWSTVEAFRKTSVHLGLPIIADGGIKECADVVKAISAGANSVMMGRVFARCPESAAELVRGQEFKLYYGMASRLAQEKWRGGLKPGTCPEGKVDKLPLGEPVDKLIERYSGAIKSGITYTGATNIKEFQGKVRFVRVQ